MYKSSQDILLEALKNDDFDTFYSIFETFGWPRESPTSDYDLLMNAIKLKRRRIVAYLLDKGCRVYVKPGILTPLHFAVVNEGWCEIVLRLILLKCPVDEKYREGRGNTAIHFAYDNGVSGEVIDLLLRGHLRNENVSNDDGLSFLHIACTRPSVDVVKMFVEADPRAVHVSEERSFYTPLHFAVQYRRYAVAEYLLQCKAKIYKQNCNKSTPLHLALKLHDFKMINLILDYDERKENVVDEFGLSHFMAACAGNNDGIVKEYLKLAGSRSRIVPSEFVNAKVQNLEGYEGYTPLHYAVDFGLQTRTVKLLLENGADCCALAANGKTPHKLAREKGHDLMCNLLNEHCSVVKKCRDEVATFFNFENVPNTNTASTNQTPDVPEEREPNRTLSVLPPPPKKRQAMPMAAPLQSSTLAPSIIFNGQSKNKIARRIAQPAPPSVQQQPTPPVQQQPSPPVQRKNPPPIAQQRSPPSIQQLSSPPYELPASIELQKALELNDFEKFLTILQSRGCPRNSQFSLLMSAINLERKREVLALLDANCQVIKYGGVGKCFATTPLHLAATKVGWSDVVERLLARGCRADDRSSKGTPVHLAFHAGNVENVVDVLLKSYVAGMRGLRRQCRGQLGFLHIACTRPSLEVVVKFVESRLENFGINTLYSKAKAAPLHFAVMHKRLEIARYLFECGADIYLQNANGSTPLHLALELRDVPMIDLILAYDKDRKDVVDRFGASHFMAACAGTNSTIVHEFLHTSEARFKISPYTLIFNQAKNQTHSAIAGYTPLHFAAHFGRLETVELLVGNGAECCLVAQNGLTCHALAQRQAHKGVHRILREHCEVYKLCREARAQSPDFGRWGEKYEWNLLLERTRTLKGLRCTLGEFRSMSFFDEVIDVDNSMNLKNTLLEIQRERNSQEDTNHGFYDIFGYQITQ